MSKVISTMEKALSGEEYQQLLEFERREKALRLEVCKLFRDDREVGAVLLEELREVSTKIRRKKARLKLFTNK